MIVIHCISCQDQTYLALSCFSVNLILKRLEVFLFGIFSLRSHPSFRDCLLFLITMVFHVSLIPGILFSFIAL